MQVNATLIAAQQAAREAQARFQANNVAPKPQAPQPVAAKAPAASFAAELDDDLFKPLPLKQTASVPATLKPAAPNPGLSARPGSQLDITV